MDHLFFLIVILVGIGAHNQKHLSIVFLQKTDIPLFIQKKQCKSWVFEKRREGEKTCKWMSGFLAGTFIPFLWLY
jgi:predicted hydrocarbon binding protein